MNFCKAYSRIGFYNPLNGAIFRRVPSSDSRMASANLSFWHFDLNFQILNVLFIYRDCLCQSSKQLTTNTLDIKIGRLFHDWVRQVIAMRNILFVLSMFIGLNNKCMWWVWSIRRVGCLGSYMVIHIFSNARKV